MHAYESNAARWRRDRSKLTTIGQFQDRMSAPHSVGRDPVAREIATDISFAALLEQLRDQACPTSLVTRTHSCSGISVKVLVEENEITPVRVGLKLHTSARLCGLSCPSFRFRK